MILTLEIWRSLFNKSRVISIGIIARIADFWLKITVIVHEKLALNLPDHRSFVIAKKSSKKHLNIDPNATKTRCFDSGTILE